jgi:NAD(P)-dependent dehydrogenase (short-subunit alcohol dehydrogenase family)
MRAMRKIIYSRDGIRVNCICPGVTDTPMTVGIAEKFTKAGLYCQTPESVGNIILGLQCATDLNGKAIYIEGGDGWEFEESFVREQPRWLGEEATRRMRVNSEAVQKVC